MAPPKGFRHSLFSIELMRKAKLGKKRGPRSLDTRQKISNSNTGKKRTPEQIDNIVYGRELGRINREYNIDIDDEPIDDEYDPYEYLYNNC